MLELHLIRHGQTDFSRENRFCGSIDPPLNEVGLRMADAFGAAYAQKGKWDAIYCSPSQRARQTAHALASRVKIRGKNVEVGRHRSPVKRDSGRRRCLHMALGPRESPAKKRTS